MAACSEPGWVVATEVVGAAGSAELALEAPGLAAVPAPDVVVAEPTELEVDGWPLVGCVAAVGCAWEVSEVGVGAGEFVDGAGVLGVVVVG